MFLRIYDDIILPLVGIYNDSPTRSCRYGVFHSVQYECFCHPFAIAVGCVELRSVLPKISADQDLAWNPISAFGYTLFRHVIIHCPPEKGAVSWTFLLNWVTYSYALIDTTESTAFNQTLILLTQSAAWRISIPDMVPWYEVRQCNGNQGQVGWG